ncbi:MAG: hypothetical protein HY689_06910 [Chloroflexi bacterium]|nr:hypothetical protein [Chloroflexota bacterium]
MTARERLHRLLDQVADEDLSAVERILEALHIAVQGQRGSMPEWPMQEAPEDDEPESAEEAAAVEAAKARIAAGKRLIPHDEARRLLLGGP